MVKLFAERDTSHDSQKQKLASPTQCCRLGAFLLVGAYGHIQAVLPSVGEGSFAGDEQLQLLLPGLILGVAGAVNIVLCKLVWDARPSALRTALLANSLALLYLIYLLWRGVPDHPIAAFTGIVASYVVLLAANRIGLVWPANDR